MPHVLHADDHPRQAQILYDIQGNGCTQEGARNWKHAKGKASRQITVGPVIEHTVVSTTKAMSMMLNSSPENMIPVSKPPQPCNFNQLYSISHRAFHKSCRGQDLAERRSRALPSMRVGGIDGLVEWL